MVSTATIELHDTRLMAMFVAASLGLVFYTTTIPVPMPARTAAAVLEPVSIAHEPEGVTPGLADPVEVLWLARCIYSETKRTDEQELVAWVVRNRVETRYRGKSTYHGVVLDPWQFSAFNQNSPKRGHYLSLDASSTAPGFQQALRIAEQVMTASPSARPFSIKTRHFYSERSMVDGAVPAWASDVRPVALDRPVDPRRFRFYERVA